MKNQKSKQLLCINSTSFNNLLNAMTEEKKNETLAKIEEVLSKKLDTKIAVVVVDSDDRVSLTQVF